MCRPFWSVMIPVYNSANYLEKTLESVLQQDPGKNEMQIEVVDDHSDGHSTEKVVRNIGKGRVLFYRQNVNVGAIGNFNTCIQRAQGLWVHILHGDDRVMPDFYASYSDLMEKKRFAMVAGRSIIIDKKDAWTGMSNELGRCAGELKDPLFKLALRNEIRTPSVVVLRETYEHVGGFNEDLVHSADWEMWTRIAAYGPVGYIPEPLSMYREHDDSDTEKLAQNAGNVKSCMKALPIIVSRFDNKNLRSDVERSARFWIWEISISTSRMFAEQENVISSFKQSFQAFKIRPYSIISYLNVIYVILKISYERFKKKIYKHFTKKGYEK